MADVRGRRSMMFLFLTLPRSKGDRTGSGVTVALPYGATELCPVRALRRWQDAAGITEGAVFRRIWRPPTRRKPGEAPLPCPVVGSAAIDAGTVARIVKARAATAGFDPRALGGHSLKRGALTTGMDRGVHPTRLKQIGRHKSYAVLDEYSSWAIRSTVTLEWGAVGRQAHQAAPSPRWPSRAMTICGSPGAITGSMGRPAFGASNFPPV